MTASAAPARRCRHGLRTRRRESDGGRSERKTLGKRLSCPSGEHVVKRGGDLVVLSWPTAASRSRRCP